MRRAMVWGLGWLLVGSAAAADGLARRIEEASAAGRTWVTWTVPSTVTDRMCCGDTESTGWGRRACSLEGGGVSWTREDPAAEPAANGVARIWVRAESGSIDRVKVFSGDCEADTAGVRTATLDAVDPAESVALLGRVLVRDGDARTGEDALTAIAVHADRAADDLLEHELVEGPGARRAKAAFWLAAARGTRGAQSVIQRFEDERDTEVRRELVFALYVAQSVEAEQTLIDAAQRDPAAEVRKQALFWIAQRAGERAVPVLEQALEDDPQGEVRQQAVFAISQLPSERGVPLLIELAREHRDPEVRRQAFFWLGQSSDPRAAEFLISTLD